MKVELSDQVVEFIRSLPPEPRRKLRLTLRKLASEQGDIKTLEGPLGNYHRLRVGPSRIIFVRDAIGNESSCIHCLFAERRGTVYTVFSEMLKKDILE